jgi:hypothetical protein
VVDALTTSELAKAEAGVSEQVEAAVAAYLADPTTGRFALGAGYELDLAATVKADRWACSVLRAGGMGERTRRTAVRNAILLAKPTPI